MAAAGSFFDADDVTRHGAGAGRALGVHAASRKIGKPGAGHGHGQQQERKPVIIYMVSPKVIHVEAHEFLPLVQRLTGPEAAAAAAAGRGDKKSGRPSTSGGAAKEAESSEGGGGARSSKTTTRAAPPVRVKARALNRPAGGPAVSVSVTATRQGQQQQQQAAAPSAAAAASPSGLLFRDPSPLRGAALKAEHHHHPLVSPGWLHHVGDHHFLSPGGGADAAALASPSSASFLDIFGPLSSQQQ